jgi:Flp pilus assembly protein TadD
MHLRQFSEAAQAFEKAIKFHPQRRQSQFNLSWAYLELGRFQDAAYIGKQAVELFPTSAMAHNNLGYAPARLKQYDEGY